jgi:hypothetical protein
LRFLAEQSTTQKNPVDKTFNARKCSLIFISPFPLIIHLYVLSMVKLDFISELINYDFTMDICLQLLEECCEHDPLPLNQFLRRRQNCAA